jgi:hypothetical protein
MNVGGVSLFLMQYVLDVLFYLFTPQATADIGVFYFLWVTIFLSVNIAWDIFTSKTPQFHLSMLKAKLSILHSATFFCSSLLLLLTIAEPNLWILAKETYVPIILAGISGILTSVPALCPYEVAAPSAV